MATINYDFCKEEELYNSGDVEQELLDIYKTGKKATIKDNPDFFYAVTPIRENIIGWYNFKENSTILEVGGGLGSITGVLCQKAKKVVSNEYSKRRAENIYYRHKECDNLEVIVGNLNEVEFKEKFDYIVLIGVFEYAKRFFKCDNPFNEFMKKMKSLLKDDGVILIAIENRYGIKYFAGAPEEHYGKRFLGFYGYENNDIQTFGQEELNKIITDSGFKNIKYYYPYPDYKMPYIIHTDAKLPLKSETTELYNHDNCLYSFDYRKTLKGIIDNKQYGFFANSFLLEISNSKDSMSDIIYSKTFWIRDEKYQVYTNIHSNKDIYKIAKNKKALNHIKNIYNINCELQNLGVNVPKIELLDGRIKIEYIDGPILTDIISDYVAQKKEDLVYKELDKFVEFLNSIASLRVISKKAINEESYFDNKKIKILKLNVIDIHTSNIVVKSKKYYLIDQEWQSEYDIPLNYVLYFSLYYLFEWIPGFDNIFNKEDIFKRYNISSEEIKVYQKMSNFFAKKELNTIDNSVLPIISKQNNIVYIEDELKGAQDENLRLNNQLNHIQEEKENLNAQIEKIKEEKVEMTKLHNEEKEKLNAQIENIKEEKAEMTKLLNEEIRMLNENYNNIINSTSWKVTKPFRKISSAFRKK